MSEGGVIAQSTSSERLFVEELSAGGGWSGVLKRHSVLRIEDVHGGANVSALFFNADLLLERYNMPDTLKAQYTAFLTRGRVLMSDMGRVLCSIVEDSYGWHDTLCGHSDPALVAAKYGRKRYQEAQERVSPERARQLPHRAREVRARQAGARPERQLLQQGLRGRRRAPHLRSGSSPRRAPSSSSARR